MIFISYRRGDTRREVTHLRHRLVERYGDGMVFVDEHMAPGTPWPDVVRDRLEHSRVVLVMVGSDWMVPATTGDDAGRPRLDAPDDWVRLEVCTAIRRGTPLIPVLVDGAVLPTTVWRCELDELPRRQRAELRNGPDFDTDLEDLVAAIEEHVPELAALGRGRAATEAVHTSAISLERALRRHAETARAQHENMRLPLLAESGTPVFLPIERMRIDLPLIVSHQRAAVSRDPRPDRDAQDIHNEHLGSHTSNLLADRAARHDDVPRDCDLRSTLDTGCRLVIVGAPGSGKTTLLQWLCHHYASRFLAAGPADDARLPDRDWLPILVMCQEFASGPPPSHVSDLLRYHLRGQQWPDADAAHLVACFERRLEDGKALLLVDGLDEIPGVERRLEMATLLVSIARRFPDAPVIATSRVVGFQAIRDELALEFDHVVIGPLDRLAKQVFVEHWSQLFGWDRTAQASLVEQVCHQRRFAKLTDTVLLLAAVAQIQISGDELPGRRVDVIRRVVDLWIQRRRPGLQPRLTTNEVLPHLEFLAYRMRKQGEQRLMDRHAIEAFRELRRLETDEPALRAREPDALLDACIHALGLLHVAGTLTDDRGFDRQVIQFFHPSFQEYFAGQALNHGRGAPLAQDVIARIRDLVDAGELRDREVVLGTFKSVEPAFVDHWQESVRLAVADLGPEQADDAVMMLLPDVATPRREARARAVFALRCLLDEPPVREATVTAVADAVIDSLEHIDAHTLEEKTWIDQTIADAYESVHGERLRLRLLEEFIASHGERRVNVGRCIAQRASSQHKPMTRDTVATVIDGAERALASDCAATRVETALRLMEEFYREDGWLRSLPPDQRDRILQALLTAAARDDATCHAAGWALYWFTGAAYRNLPPGAVPPAEADQDAVIDLDPREASVFEDLLQRLDPNDLSPGVEALRCEHGVVPIAAQQDWIYELAQIADGATPRRALAPPGPTGRVRATSWLQAALRRATSLDAAGGIAQILGGFGVLRPDLVPHLAHVFSAQRYTMNDRDEALMYLALIGGPDATRLLVEAADHRDSPDNYRYTRGLFGLLLLDDVDVLAGQLRKALPRSDLNAYAYGLAGSRDPRGRTLLEQIARDAADPRVVEAARKALDSEQLRP